MKKLFSFYLPYFCVILVVSLCDFAAGGFIIEHINDGHAKALNIVSYVCLGLLFVFATINPFIGYRYYKKKLPNTSIKQLSDNLWEHIQLIRMDYARAKKKINSVYMHTVAYLILVVVLCLLCIFGSFNHSSYTCLFVSVLILYGLVLPYNPRSVHIDMTAFSKKRDYPYLYSMAEDAAKRVGVKGQIYISFSGTSTASIASNGNKILISLYPAVLNILQEEELYAILIHEMAHIKNGNTDIKHFLRLLFYFKNTNISYISTFILKPFLIYAKAVYVYEYNIFSDASSVIVEELADRTVAEYSDITVAGNALFKIHCFNEFVDKLEFYTDFRHLKAETFLPNISQLYAELFLENMQENEEAWRELVKKEIQPRGASHPILRTRLEIIGASKIRLTMPESIGIYREECKKVSAESDRAMCEASSADYKEFREKYYVKPLKAVKEWQDKGKPCNAVDARSILDALLAVGMYDDALGFTDEIIANQKGGLVLYAKFQRGKLRLEKQDNGGIDDLYDAAEGNNNFIEDSMALIGDYCCKMGLHDRLEEHREICYNYYQKDADTDGLGWIRADDDLSEEKDMPQHIKDRNLEYILDNGEAIVTAVYLIHKQVTDDFYTSVYIIKYSNDASDEAIEALERGIFEYLDNDPDDWQYSLFEYKSEYERIFKNIPNCRIYFKE